MSAAISPHSSTECCRWEILDGALCALNSSWKEQCWGVNRTPSLPFWVSSISFNIHRPWTYPSVDRKDMWRFCLHPFLASAQLQILRATHRTRKPKERRVLGTTGGFLRPGFAGCAADKGRGKAEAWDDMPFQNVLLLWPNSLSVPYFLDGNGASSLSGNDAGLQNLHHNLAFWFYGLFQGTMSRMSEQNERISDFSKAFRVMQIKTHYLRSNGMPGKWLLWPQMSK